MGLAEENTGGGRGNENVREWKYYNNPSIYEYNNDIM
jgi:hypothetical protein